MAQQATTAPVGQTIDGEGVISEEMTGRSIRLLSHRQLVLLYFRKNRLGVLGLAVLIALYVVAFFCQFIAPYEPSHRFQGYVYAHPTRLHLRTVEGQWMRPFMYPITRTTDPQTFERKYTEDTSTPYPLQFFVKGDPYAFLGVIETDVHLYGVAAEGGPVMLLGADSFGRDLLSRIFYGSRISLTVGLVGVFLSLVIGLVLGGVSGFYGGMIDNVVQRMIEMIRCVPTIPLWMGLAAALPSDWPQLRVYFGITIILSLVGWTTLARVIRGKFLSLREEDYVLAAIQAGAKPRFVISEHLVPAFTSYILVHLTLAIPVMIIGETSLSFLGLGLTAPTISWGVLLKDAQKVQEVALHPWILAPAFLVLVSVMAFNFFGDGLRDAVDPYSQRS